MAVKYVSDINGWTWTEGVREEILRKISGSGREEFTGGWKTCSVVNDVICNRIKGYDICVCGVWHAM
jgi:hypothetical protein